MSAVDDKSVWVTQGWMFYSAGWFWQAPQVEAFVSGPPTDKLIVIDLHAEQHPIYQTTESFYGTPFIWSSIFNFGGRSGMYGHLEELDQGLVDVLANSTVVGIGAGEFYSTCTRVYVSPINISRP